MMPAGQLLRPAELVAYLRSRGWRVADDGYEGGALWEKTDDRGTREVFVPMAEEAPDYGQVVHRLISGLAAAESRDAIFIARDIRESSGDVIRFRVSLDGSDSSRLPLAVAPAVFKAAHDVTISAANAVSRRRSHYKKWTNEVHNFAQQAEVGQTEPGSYVVRVLCPLTRVPEPQLQISEKEPFGRRVTVTLSTALAASIRASRAAITNGDLSVFDETIQAGVSSNLCRALASVRGPVAVATTLEVQMRWAHLRGHTPPSEGAFFFGADTLEVLDSAASHLRDQEEEILENQTIYGFVTKCERGAVANSGLIVVEGWVEGEPPTRVSCQVQLAGEEYAAAARAHAERKLVALVGTTHRVGRRWTVDQVDSFSTETDVEGDATPID